MNRTAPRPRALVAAAAVLTLTACGDGDVEAIENDPPAPDPLFLEEGRTAFRTGTFGTEAFWTDAVRLGEGLAAEDVTLLDALRLGLQLDADELGLLAGTLAAELETDLSPAAAPTLNDPLAFESALAVDAVIGLVARDRDGDGLLSLGDGDTLGVSCALCHGISDGSSFDGTLATSAVPGSIGRRMDGPSPLRLDVAGLFALAANSRALYPYMPQSHAALGGFPISRSGEFVTQDATEAEVDALLRDKSSFPIGTWDTVPDGIGAPVVLPPIYDIRRAAPYGVAGAYDSPVNFVNAHITLGLDPTTLLTVPGSVFLGRVAPGLSNELDDEYRAVLVATNVPAPAGGFPYADAVPTGETGTEFSPIGFRVERLPLSYVSGYLTALFPLPPAASDPAAIARGRASYDVACAVCHGAFRGLGVLPMIPLSELKLDYDPTTLLVRGFPFTDVRDDTGTIYDDRVVLFDNLYREAPVPAVVRDIPAPRLIGLHLRGPMLHNGSVPSLDALLDPGRGPAAPHAYYVPIRTERDDLVEFLRSE